MKQEYIEDLARSEGEEVLIKGWLYNKRSSGKIHFLLVRDGTGIAQAVATSANVGDEAFELCSKLTQESSLEATGRVRKDERAPGGYEIELTGMKLISLSNDYPITPKEHGIDFLLDRRHLWIRSTRQNAILRIRSEIIKAARDFLDDRKFILVDSPILTPSACEGTSTLFEVNYFDDKAYLTQSGQLYNEASAMAFGKVYCFGPTFRAEKSKTRRHLTEFWMIEPEVAFATLDDTMMLIEEFVSYIVGRVLDKRGEELKRIERDTTLLEKVAPSFPKISYDEAVRRLKEKGQSFEWGGDFGAADETILAESFETPVFVHRFPTACKAFYMKSDPADEKLSLSCDLLAPEGYGEIVGGGERSDNLAYLEKKVTEEGLPQEHFEWYLDLRRYGSCPHSGFGLGIERTVAWVCGLEHVRETIPFPRMIYRIRP